MHVVPEGAETSPVAGDSVVAEVASHFPNELLMLPGNRIVPMIPAPLRNPANGAPKAIASRLPFQRIPSGKPCSVS